eukprot:TRINITY_DN2115_c0_g1_i3.p1 TRINITY_DN2115_c0_g1~~TRINITY_DN2115_c0_g1_i3.p1  ORF type:complete len:509 (+),score=97.55 TRINITY_DN2115_c0_g1_i3:219-1745(+)
MDDEGFDIVTGEVDVFSSILFGASLFVVTVLPALLLLHRDNPLLRVRYLYICITEIIIVGIVLAITASTTSNTFFAAWASCPVWVYNFIITAFSAVIWNVTASRLMLFYRAAQVNTWTFELNNGVGEALVHFFGLINAPREFGRFERRLQILKEERNNSTNNNNNGRRWSISSSSPSSSPSSSMHFNKNGNGSNNNILSSQINSINSDAASDIAIIDTRERVHVDNAQRIFRTQTIEIILWALKLLVWWLLWGGLATLVTYMIAREEFFTSLKDVSQHALLPSTYVIEAQLVFWNILQFGIVLTWLPKSRDSLGLRDELIFMQSLFLIMWVADGVQILVRPLDYSKTGLYLDLLAMFVHASITAIYPLVLIYYRRYRIRQFNESHTGGLVIHELWQTGEGRALITEVVAQGLSIETTLFLQETDSTNEYNTRHITQLYKKFIVQGAPFEVNIPGQLRDQWTTLCRDPSVAPYAPDIVRDTRAEIFVMIQQNFGHQIHRALLQTTNDQG